MRNCPKWTNFCQIVACELKQTGWDPCCPNFEVQKIPVFEIDFKIIACDVNTIDFSSTGPWYVYAGTGVWINAIPDVIARIDFDHISLSQGIRYWYFKLNKPSPILPYKSIWYDGNRVWCFQAGRNPKAEYYVSR